MEKKQLGEELVFGLDIGTRNVVGTVGYRMGEEFVVLAQYSKEHETRAMLDGQIHNIGRVGNTIRIVKEALEEQTGQTLSSVCVAAAGRVLKTVTTNIEYVYEEETVVPAEDIHTLDLLGIEKAQATLKEQNDTNYKFYCVGYSVVKYYLNDEVFSSIEGHKAEKIAEDIIVTFLPEDVIDGLYAAVAIAGLSVANLTLEPIAAIDIAIPEHFRMLNIALVDVGAGTSDISVTRDGSIIAYGMIPIAGDEVTEIIVQHYLVDFKMAEHIKLASTRDAEVEYTDIMMLKHTVRSEEVWDLVHDLVDRMTTEVANKIIELNGSQSVKAAFIVGGGGKIHGFDTMLAEKLGLPYERVALRGEEVLQNIIFEQPGIEKDPLIVTPIGICLNYFEQRNSFIMVHFNGERIKLYDNNRLTIVDAALQAGFPNEYLFPKRGREINFTVNGSPRIARGETGESAIVKVNDKLSNINAPLIANSYITVEPSTAGESARVTIEDIADYTYETMLFIVNGRNVRCPKFVEVNGSIALSSYEIQEGDAIETRNFYTIEQLAEFMDVEVDMDFEIFVNNRPADLNTLVYENFTIDWVVKEIVRPKAPEPEALPNEAGTEQESFELVVAESAETTEEAEISDGAGDIGSAERESGAQERTSASNEPENMGAAEPVGNMEGAAESAGNAEGAADTAGGIEGTAESADSAEDAAEPAGNTEGAAEYAGSAEDAAEPAGNTEGAAEYAGSAEDSADTAGDKEGLGESAGGAEGVADENGFTLVGTEEIPAEQKAAEEQPEPPKLAEPEPVDINEYDPKITMRITVNGEPVELKGKLDYIFVDIFDYIDFDLSDSRGRAIITTVNGENTGYMQPLYSGDEVEIYWKETD